MKEVWEVLDPPSDCVVYWFGRKPGGSELVGSWVESPYGLFRIAERFKDWNLYVGLNPARRSGKLRISRGDVTHLQTILIDIDPIAPGPDPLAASEEVLKNAELLLGEELHPTVIDSGRGVQLWLRFERTPLLSEDLAAGWEYATGTFLRRLAEHSSHGCRVDTSCHDLCRLARLPGTVNQKTSKAVRLLERGRVHGSDVLLRLATFGERLDPRPVPVGGNELHSWQRAYASLTVTARRFITEGVGEPGRHHDCYAAAASMRDCGVRFESAVQAILLGASLCLPPLPEPEALYTVRNAYKGRKGGGTNWHERWLEQLGEDHRLLGAEER